MDIFRNYTLAATLAGKLTINKNDLKPKLYMHNTIGDVAMTHISISIILCSIQNKGSSFFLSLVYVLSIFWSFGYVLRKKGSYKKRVYIKCIL